jgi:rfaE bifunctional protein kinase chain/domain
MNYYKEKLENLNFLIIGDIMLDEYLIGKVERISPESPTPIVEIINKKYNLGGCGNVVKNLKSLGCKCSCISQIKYDSTGKQIINLLNDIKINKNYIFENKELNTSIKKTRILNDEHQVQMLRFDEEDIKTPNHDLTSKLKNIDYSIYDAIIVSDYGKGMINEDVMNIIKNNHNKIFVDPKPKNKKLYDDVYMITPNKKEWNEIKNENYKNIKYILNTIGKDGMILYQKNKHPYHIKTETKKVYNVTGAGDTVISVMAVCDSLNYNMKNACYLANKSAQYVIQYPDTAYIPQLNFISFLSQI